MIRYLMIGILWGYWLAPVLAQQDVYLKIQSGAFQPVSILVIPFEGSPETEDGARIESVLTNDLTLSGFFRILKDYYSDGGNEGNRLDHTAALPDAAVVLEGEVEATDDRLTLSARLTELPSQRLIFQKRFADSKQNYRSVAHRAADEIVKVLIGVAGIAQTQITYISKRRGTKELYLMDYDGHGVWQLTNTGSINLSPSWSPDREKIAFTSYLSGNPELYLIDVKDLKMTRLSGYPGLNTTPDWSPDGKKIALTLTKDGNPEIYVMDIKDRKPKRLTFSPGIDTSPSWSPTGREIAFTSDRSGNPQIYIMDADGANVRRLTYEGSYNVSPAWSPRGDRIAFVSREDNAFTISVIDINGENMIRLTESRGRNEDPAWSPNGFHIAFSSNIEGNSHIYIMRWDGSNIRRLTRDGNNYSPSWSSPRFK